MAVNPGIEEIQVKRRKLLEALDANVGFEQGLHDSSTDQYAVKCHFIYELLQNAGDAGASHVKFILAKDSLEFRHDGTRVFKIEDVNSITNYHQSTKKGTDYEAIGKFGMGFKSVFYYTQHPEIHSGDYHFRICRMFFPETREVLVDDSLDGWTKFVFPFDHPRRSPKETFAEVRRGLSEIQDVTLLFLKKIREIECLFDDGKAHLRIVREECGHIVRIRKTDSAGKSSDTYYLKFSKKVTPLKLNASVCEIGIAFGLGFRSGIDKLKAFELFRPSDFFIKPIYGRVFVYFPADKEESHLRFHINAPFATPMSRESLVDNRDNDWILGQLAELTVSSLEFLRDNQLLHIETLALFPMEDDQLPVKYQIFENRIIDAFNNQALTPTKSGAYKPARNLIRSDNRMSELFSDEDMSVIYPRYQTPLWVKAPSMNHSREDKFLSQLEIDTFGDDGLKVLVTGTGKSSDNFVVLVKTFSDDKLLALYRKLSTIEFGKGVAFRAIFKSSDGGFYVPSQLYFEPLELTGSVDGKFLKKVYKDSDQRIISFFKSVGVSEYSAENILADRIQGDCEVRMFNPSEAENHFKNVKLLISSFRSNQQSLRRFHKFLWICMDSENKTKLAPANEIIIDEPYEKTGMRYLWAAYNHKCLLSKVYCERLSECDFQLLKEIFRKLDFVRDIKLHYIEVTGYISVFGHPRCSDLMLPYGRQQRDPWYHDCDIEKVDDLVKLIDDNISTRLWRLICALNETDENFRHPFKSICHYSGSFSRESDSLLVCHLQDKPWIKDIDGKWCKPADVCLETLSPIYEPRGMCPGLRAIKFGIQIEAVRRANVTRQKEFARFLESVGAKDEEEIRSAIEQFHEAKDCGIDVRELIRKKRDEVEMPEVPVRDVIRRRTHARDDYKEAPLREYEIRSRSVRSGPSVENDARARLERDYKDENGKIRCQLCNRPMPFNKRDGRQYFECMKIFIEMARDSPDQYLALCPSCGAVYDEWVRKSEKNANTLLNEIVSQKIADGQRSIVIPLPGYGTPLCPDPPIRGKWLYFVGTHFTDIQGVLQEEALNRQDK